MAKVDPSLISLNRCFLTARLMKEHLTNPAMNPDFIRDLSAGERAYIRGYYGNLFYSLFYVVIEGWEEMHLQDEKINDILKNRPYVKSLKRFRNANFHFQNELLGEKLLNFLELPNSKAWIDELWNEFNRFFRVCIK